MHRISLLVLALAAVLARPAVAGPIDKLTFYTEEFPPYQYTHEGRLQGLFITLVREMFKVADTKKEISDIRVRPWSRGFNTALREPNTVLFGTSRTEEREDKFLWVGPAMPSNHGIFAKKAEGHTPESLDYFNDYRTATIRDDVAEQLMLSGGVDESNLMRQSDHVPIIRSLERGRADFWAYNVQVGYYMLNEQNVAHKYEVVHTLKEGSNYLAVNPDSDPAAVQALRDALAKVKASPRYEEILNANR
jgi:polar amino acid transport system substrate-binding protein